MMAMLSLICGAATYSYGDVNLLTAAKTVLQSYTPGAHHLQGSLGS